MVEQHLDVEDVYKPLPETPSTAGSEKPGRAVSLGQEASTGSTRSETSLPEVGNDSDNIQSLMELGWPVAAFVAQVFPPFFLAGLGMVAAGLLFGKVHRWTVFMEVKELIIMVPPLLGLKGNLEMTLASRLSTHANLGHFDKGYMNDQEASNGRQTRFVNIVVGNFMAVQCQAIIVGFLASLVAFSLNAASTGGTFEYDHALPLSLSAVAAASTASLLLALVMTLVVVASRRCGINPDNVASPIAGMLGDVCTLALLSFIANHVWDSRQDYWQLQYGLLVLYGALAVASGWATTRNEFTSGILSESWVPVLLSMLVSSSGGLILKHADSRYHQLASFAPVMNGAGGNLAAVHTSRLSTSLHVNHAPSGSTPKKDAITLTGLMVPGALCFSSLIIGFNSHWQAVPGVGFTLTYAAAAVLQVWVLMVVASLIVKKLWSHGLNPDNAAIPYVTSLGDLVGASLLASAFVLLDVSDVELWAGCDATCRG